MGLFKFSVILTIFLSYLSLSECIATYSIDLSSEFIKVAIVKPGVPMEIALDKESQRKTAAVVYIHKNERLFGNAAMNMGIKYPQYLYHSITTLIGKSIDHPIVQQFMANYPYFQLQMDDNNQLVFKHDENTVFSVEELLAMILENAKNIAETYSEMSMKGGIIVVPPYFSQEERLAVLRAARIADINVLQLMNSNAAVALNYGIFRRKSFNATVQYYMFYDVGSTATVVSIAGYQIVKAKEFGMMTENPQLSIIGLGYDRSLGASQFILRIQNHLADSFNKLKKLSKDVKKYPRSMAKLYKEASRVLKVLSANNEIYAQVENVLDEQDLKLRITRSEMEEMCSDLFARFSEPVHKALESAQIPMPVIKEVILMGGGSRIPRFQEILLKVTDLKELGKSINTDEAAALGAVYQAAYISPGFKVKTFIVKDANLVPISVDFVRFKTTEDKKEIPHFTSRMIFDLMNLFPMKRVLTFNKHSKNFQFNVTYGTQDVDKKTLFSVEVNNLTDVHSSFMEPAEKYVTDFKGVKAHFGIDASGLVTLNYVEAIFERKWNKTGKPEVASTFEKIGNTISNLFGSSSEEQQPEKTANPEEPIIMKNNTDTGNNDTQTNKTTTANVGEDAKNQSKKETEPKIELLHQNLNVINTYRASLLPPEDVIENSRKRIIELKAIDDNKAALEKAQNDLESYIFLVKNQFEKDTYVDCSTELERSAALEAARNIGEWYEEQGVNTPKEEYIKRYQELENLMFNIDFRVKELSARPEMISRLNSILNTSNVFLENIKNLTGENKIFTQAEHDSLSKLIADTVKWYANANATFKSMKLNEHPKIITSDFEPHFRALEREIGYLLNKISIWKSQPPPPPPNSSSSSNDTQNNKNGTKEDESKSTDKTQSSDDKDSVKPDPDSSTQTDQTPDIKDSPDKKPDEHVDL